MILLFDFSFFISIKIIHNSWHNKFSSLNTQHLPLKKFKLTKIRPLQYLKSFLLFPSVSILPYFCFKRTLAPFFIIIYHIFWFYVLEFLVSPLSTDTCMPYPQHYFAETSYRRAWKAPTECQTSRKSSKTCWNLN